MSNTVRPASESDLPAILQLTREKRALLARLDPVFWRPAANADDLHPAFITYLVGK